MKTSTIILIVVVVITILIFVVIYFVKDKFKLSKQVSKLKKYIAANQLPIVLSEYEKVLFCFMAIDRINKKLVYMNDIEDFSTIQIYDYTTFVSCSNNIPESRLSITEDLFLIISDKNKEINLKIYDFSTNLSADDQILFIDSWMLKINSLIL